jgi:hypothetical protein
MGDLLKLLIPFGIAFAIARTYGNGTVKSGVENGARRGGTYQWQVIKVDATDAPGPFAARVRKVGAGEWTDENIVAYGMTGLDAQKGLQEWMLNNT